MKNIPVMDIEDMLRTEKEAHDKLRKSVVDMHAFVIWAFAHGCERLIVPTLAHDLGGIAAGEEGFSPRSWNYSQTH